MRALLKMTDSALEDLREHLLRKGSFREEAAFLYVRVNQEGSCLDLEVVAVEKMERADFVAQHGDYLELADSARARVIKRAHDLGAALVEAHSHPGKLPAEFSFADRRGLQETVPHMFWRLPGKPYLALVFADSGFDALLWVSGSKPQALDGVQLDASTLTPTNSSLWGWS